MSKDKWKEKYVKSIKECTTDEEIGNVVNKIFEAGFQDGTDEGNTESEPDTSLKEGLMEMD